MEVLGNATLKFELFLFRSLEHFNALFNSLEHVLLKENIRHYEVKKTPKLLEVVVERCTSEEKPEAGLELIEAKEVLRLVVFYFMRLVNDKRFPIDARERQKAGLGSLVVSDDDVKLPWSQDLFYEFFPRESVEYHQSHLRRGEPFCQLSFPIARY